MTIDNLTSTASGHPLPWLRRARLIAAIAAVTIGMLALLGWIYDVPALRSLAPGLVAMKADTAVAIVLGGAALWFTPAPAARVAAVGVLLIGAATLAEYVVGRGLGIDELLFRDLQPGSDGPGRMAVSTAGSFVFLGAALLLARGSSLRARRVAEFLSASVGVLVVSIVAAYMVGISALAGGMATYSIMAMNTAAALAALSVGLLCAMPESRIIAGLTGPGRGSVRARRLVAAAIAVPILVGWLRLLGAQAGWYTNQFGISEVIVATIALISILVLGGLGTAERIEGERHASEGRAIEEIRESELRFRQLTDNMNEVFFVQDIQFRETLYVSPAYERIWGRSCQSLLDNPRSFVDAVPVEDRERVFANMAQVQAGQTPGDLEFRVVQPDGATSWVLSRVVPVRNEQGEVYRLAGVTTDVTEQKLARDALAQRARLSALNGDVGIALARADSLEHMLQRCTEAMVDHLDAAFARIWTLNDQTSTLELQASAGLYTHLNGPHGRVPVGQFKIGLIAQERQPHLTNAVIGDACVSDQEWAKREGMVAFAGYPLIVQDQVVGVMAMFARQPFSDFVQRALASIADAVAQGIARKRGEAVIRQLTQALEQSPTGVFITDTEGTIQYVNRKFTELTGYGPAEAIGKNPRFLKSGKTAPDVYRKLWEQIKAGAEWRGVLQNRRKDGGLWWNAATISPLRDANGTVTNFLAMQEDVTAQRLLEDQFRQAQKMEAVGRLAGGVAHDFNNLLTVISSYSELLLADLPAEDHGRRDDLGQIRKAATDAAALTRQLLAFSRQQVIESKELDLNAIVTGAGKMLERLIGEDITLATVLAPDLGWVKADAGQIEQVIMNLAVNARDAMPQGGKVTIATANADLDASYVQEHPMVPTGSYVQLSVSDTGVGMSEEVKRRIFEPFFTTKDPGKGTGLGLATVYGIVKQSNGFVWVYSEPGRGATFKIYLPRVAETERPTQRPGASPPSARGTETVLLAEDAAPVRAVARAVLERHGYTVLEAPHGRAALDIVAKYRGPIHLLLTDVVMPEMSGRQLAEQLAVVRPDVRILYVSGYTDDSVVRHGVLEAGMAYLQKPFTPDALARRVREVLDGKGQ